jgi:hypothetical protein
MPAIYVLNKLDSKRAVTEDFETKKAAKAVRNKLKSEGTVCVVSRGPDHPAGPSKVDPRCQNTERTSRKRRRNRVIETVEETLADIRKIGR